MFSKIINKFKRSLALRLTVWYAGIFVIFSVISFTLIYFSIAANLQTLADEDLIDDINEFTALLRSGGIERVEKEIFLETQGREAQQAFFRLWTRNGHLLMTSDLSSWSGLTEPTKILAQLRNTDKPLLETLEFVQHEFNVRSIYAPIGPNAVLQIGESLEDNKDFLETLLKGFFIALAIIILLGGPIGWFMAKRALRGIQEITRAASLIKDGALEQRVVVRSQGDELDRLAYTFNTMLDRIQTLIIGMREMTDNLAHDLRSPLGRMRAAAEIALTHDRSKIEMETIAITTTEECDRLLEMINTTLDIAEAESGAAKLKLVDIDLVALINDALDLFQSIAEDKAIILNADLPNQCRIQGDRQRLQRIIASLLDNALKYTTEGGSVTLALITGKEKMKLSIKDTGIGMSVEETTRIFERFYRCDRSRTQQGTGLGLNLAQAFVRAHGGDISVASTPNKGSTFTVTLPHMQAG